MEPATQNSPIVFFSPDLRPDTRLKVFEQEFHVHSIYLKLNSAFFRKFLDSPDKAYSTVPPTVLSGAGSIDSAASAAALDSVDDLTFGSAPRMYSGGSPGNLKYDWTSKVDDEGGWYLVCKSTTNEPYNLSAFYGDKNEITSAFEKLLCTFYNQPYILSSAQDFCEMVELADYYRALPTISRTLDGALFNSPDFIRAIEGNALKLFPIASKVRHTLLFEECLVWIVNPYSSPKFVALSDARLRMTARCAHGEISTMVAKSMKDIMQVLSCGLPRDCGWGRGNNQELENLMLDLPSTPFLSLFIDFLRTPIWTRMRSHR